MSRGPEETGAAAAPLSPADLVIFGGTGDLARRKIIPALYYRLRAGQMPESSRIFLLGRQDISAERHRACLREACEASVPPRDFTAADFERLAARASYVRLEAARGGDYAALKALLEHDPRPVSVFYLATPAALFAGICAQLRAAGLAAPGSRVVLEKPIGHDLASFAAINRAVLSCFGEEQIYRIDHYLGKETVQNLMVLRFGNALFERVWNGDAIDHVQITVAETIGVGERFGYYDSYGALRDMVQNHLLQLLCLLAMEPPAYITADAVRDEKLKVLRALRPIAAREIRSCTVRGQYRGGMVNGAAAASYAEDIGGGTSGTETFAAIKLHLDNWRWSGVPFYLRTGKRLAERYSEVVIQFRPVPHNIFPHHPALPETNKLAIRLQPDEHVKLQMNTKVPGPGGYRLMPVHLNLSLADAFGERTPDAYERLLMDVVRGNPILFMRSDEVEAAWRWTESVLDGWRETGMESLPYAAGSWGPQEAGEMLARDGRRWYHGEE